MKKILFTGGGSAGHVMVNLALIPRYLQEGWSVDYIGSETGIERQLTEGMKDVRYHAIATGKLRRYLSWQNVKDPFKVIQGVGQAYRIIRKIKPDIVFSKGGFVSVPVVLGAWLNRIPVLIHESDLTPGLANRISIPFASGVCTTFPETAEGVRSGKFRHIGPIVRPELLQGSAQKGRAICGFDRSKPVLMVMGGSLGAKKINETVRAALPELSKHFQIVHLCGKNGLDRSLEAPGYKQFEYVNEELPHLLAMTEAVVSRAGSNAIFEFLALGKPMLLIPLPKGQSRGDQLLNAESFRKSGYCEVLQEQQMTAASLAEEAVKLYANREDYRRNMGRQTQSGGIETVMKWIAELTKRTAR